jgi:hypothetical protein
MRRTAKCPNMGIDSSESRCALRCPVHCFQELARFVWSGEVREASLAGAWRGRARPPHDEVSENGTRFVWHSVVFREPAPQKSTAASAGGDFADLGTSLGRGEGLTFELLSEAFRDGHSNSLRANCSRGDALEWG